MTLEALAMGATALGGLVSAGTGVANWFSQDKAYQDTKKYQDIAWSREDNAIQRRVADLKAAGLNPVLAAGSPAQSSGPISLKPPQLDGVGEGLSKMAQVLPLMALKKDIQNKDMTNQILQIEKGAKEFDYSMKQQFGADMATATYEEKMAENQITKELLNQQKIKTQSDAVNLDLLKKFGFTNQILGAIGDLTNIPMVGSNIFKNIMSGKYAKKPNVIINRR